MGGGGGGEVQWKIWFLEGFYEKQMYKGELPKKEGLDSFQV